MGMIAGSPTYYEIQSVSSYGGVKMMNHIERTPLKSNKNSPGPFYIERVYAGRRNAEEVVTDMIKAHCR